MTRFRVTHPVPVRRRTALKSAVAFAVLSCARETTAPVGGATRLVLSAPPATTVAGAFLAPAMTVTALDASGRTVTSFTGLVTLAFDANPGGATLSGSMTEGATAGVATFGSVVIDKAAAGYTLVAKSGSLTSAPSAAFAIAPLTFASLTAGRYHTCALAAGGAAFCWGDNEYGELGDGTTTRRPAPTPVAEALAFTSLTAGNGYTCGLTTAGAAFCWGDNGSGNLYGFGELGDGTGASRTTPVPVEGGPFATLAAGKYHSCALTASGAAYCWGDDTFGQLGDSTFIVERFAPVAVRGGLEFTSIAVGGRHSCALTAAGAAYCWGSNSTGQLGDGTNVDRTTPVAVQGGLAFTSLTAGFAYTCGKTAAGAAYCWGANSIGAFGDATTVGRTTPTPAAGGLTLSSLGAGYDYTCGLTPVGIAYCWGDNGALNMLGYGELGDGTTTQRLTPTAVAGNLIFASLAVGDFHACGITTGGAAYCWGYNADGEVGDRTTVNRSVPTAVIP